jgi:hypothetical protein
VYFHSIVDQIFSLSYIVETRSHQCDSFFLWLEASRKPSATPGWIHKDPGSNRATPGKRSAQPAQSANGIDQDQALPNGIWIFSCKNRKTPHAFLAGSPQSRIRSGSPPEPVAKDFFHL